MKLRDVARAGLVLFATACAPAPGAPGRAAKGAAPAVIRNPAGVDGVEVDASVRPGDDFFRYANGPWLVATEIPADHSGWGAGAAIAERTARRVADLIAEADRGAAPPGSDARKVGDYYATLLDEAAIEAKGLAPLAPALAAIDAIGDARGLARALGASLRADVDPLNATDFHTRNVFGLWVAQDFDDPARYAPFLLPGGLGLYDRDDYADPSPRAGQAREAYRAYLAALFALAGLEGADERAARAFDLERRIAEVHAGGLDARDVRKGNNRWARRDFASRAPGLDWAQFFAAAGLDRAGEFVVWQPAATAGIAALVRSQPLAAWRDFLRARTLQALAPYLPRAFGDAWFAFHGGAMRGTPRRPARWKFAVDGTDLALGQAVGRLYVERHFPPSERARAEAIARDVVAAFARRIDALDWMAPETKARARAKLAALKIGVGYPDAWRDYAGLDVVRGDAAGNAERAALFEYRRNVSKLGRPVDRGEWALSPHQVNAVNLPAMNALNLPAAILQPPAFDPARPEAMDYGSTGMTVGHELCHGFDDQGSLFDEAGRLAEWWTAGDRAHFAAAAERLVRQYDAYRPFADAHVDGRRTLSENIADVAGLAAAYDAYRLSAGARATKAAGAAGDRLFFLGFAQSWRTKAREPARRRQLQSDFHAPEEYRVDTVRNLDAWYAAFDVAPGQALYLAPADRVRIY